MRIAVLTGGATAERAVAFASAAQVVGALRARGHEVAVVDTVAGPLGAAAETASLTLEVGAPPDTAGLDARERRFLSERLAAIPQIRRADVVFVCLHGGRGEGGVVQALLETVGVPYTGSGPLASALAMDKDLAKRVVRAAAVPVPAWLMAPVTPDAVHRELGWPTIVKPSRQGSSVGLTLVAEPAGLGPAIALARQHDDEVMVERYASGREFTVGVLADRALPVGEIIPRSGLFDYEAKYSPGGSEEVFPAAVSPAIAARLQELGLSAHRALKLGGYSRIDFRLDQGGDILFLEANTLPGLTAASLLPKGAQAAGIAFPDLCEEICRLARNATPAAGNKSA
jgi:D-alanine-D-alanine ligase